jgi:hypothetical protein
MAKKKTDPAIEDPNIHQGIEDPDIHQGIGNPDIRSGSNPRQRESLIARIKGIWRRRPAADRDAVDEQSPQQ